MATIALIGCSKRKSDELTNAKDLYQGALFKLSYQYAHLIADDSFILSAKYNVISPYTLIHPYDYCLKDLGRKLRKEWAKNVISNLRVMTTLNTDKYIILAGKNYYEFLLPYLPNYEVPMMRLGIGEQLKFLKQAIKALEKPNAS